MTDHVICPHCHEITHIGGLIGKNTNDCPKCGKAVLSRQSHSIKPQFLFFFENEPKRVAVDDRQRTARMLRSYRSKPADYQITRTAPNSYSVRVKGFPSPIIIHSQENIA